MKTLETLEIRKLNDAAESVKGTSAYHIYNMETYSKVGNHWAFIGWGIPNRNLPAIIKQYKGKKYIYQGENRYTVRESVEFLLKN